MQRASNDPSFITILPLPSLHIMFNDQNGKKMPVFQVRKSFKPPNMSVPFLSESKTNHTQPHVFNFTKQNAHSYFSCVHTM